MNREHWIKMQPYIDAFCKGITVQLCIDGQWFDISDYCDFARKNPEHLRIKPSPKLREWKPEEVPMEARFMWRTECGPFICFKCIRLDDEFFSVINGSGTPTSHTLSYMKENAVHSIDCGKTWHPCGVLE